ncbi:hypothetical protein MKP08_06540 [Erythrobacter sp. LQ02-29]|uniref:DUF2946 family protein n=1 Tax=Erythrobacter sp. LQ02-29 TaxID=2920384 RepID=UPI001F4D6B62|nr:DUF2946 family protein [Erythrobacter sp. LQ02-29]MCP9222403.1 hypothetical protein [Erythrobacter sp. LQ02-29]
MISSGYHALRFGFLCLAAFAVAMGAAVPRGWMPMRGADGSFAVTICSEGLTPTEQAVFAKHARAMMAAAMGHGGHEPTKPDSMSKHCPYGVAAHTATFAPQPDIDVPTPAPEQAIFAALPPVSIGQGLAAPPPPATGPPSHT